MMDAFPWILFHFLIIIALWIDLTTASHLEGPRGIRFALLASLGWIILALLFGAWVWHIKGPEEGVNYITAYLVEKALSVDNLFVFLVLFKMFDTPIQYRRKVLFWGVLGAVVMRALFIFAGIALVQRFHWILYIFAVMLLILSYKLLFKGEKAEIPRIVTFVKKHLPISSHYEKGAWFVKENGRWLATPLLMTLIAIELTDVMFAIDSIPAVMGITLDPLVVYTSNIFAVLGLRALYFAMSALLEMFRYLNLGLAVILSFIAVKILLEGYVEISNIFSLLFVACVLVVSALASLAMQFKSFRQ